MSSSDANNQEEKPEYSPAAYAKREIERLQKQHAWIRNCLGGKIVFAPVDLKQEGLKVHDIGCADGEDYSNPSATLPLPPPLPPPPSLSSNYQMQ